MEVRNLKKFIPFALFLFCAAALSSCNKGLGCPTFSVEDAVEVVVDQAIDAILPEKE